MGLEIFPLKIPNFSIIFPSVQKNLIGLSKKVPGSKMGQLECVAKPFSKIVPSSSLPKIRHTVCQLSGVYSPDFRCIAPVYMWHTGIYVLMVQISL